MPACSFATSTNIVCEFHWNKSEFPEILVNVACNLQYIDSGC